MSSDSIPPDSADTVDPGKRLVRTSGLSGFSLGERLINHFHRLTWRTPLHALRLKGRHPLKLLVVPEDPVAGDPARGQAIVDGTLAFTGENIAIADIDFGTEAISQVFQDHLQSFAWLRDLAAVPDRKAAAAVAERLMRVWLDRHGATVTDPAWRADIWGRRTLFWSAYAPLILSGNDLVYRSAVLNGLARGARHLDRVAGRVTIGVPRIVAATGMIAAGLMMPGGEARRAVGEAALNKAIDIGFTADGGTVCRSPANLALAIEALAMLAKIYDARRITPPACIGDTLARAVPALLGVTMGDGAFASWQGGVPESAAAINRLVEATGMRTRPLRQARDWGYQRIQCGQTIISFDGAPPPVSRVAAAGSASTLAFEMTDGAHRVIVSCGGARFTGPAIPFALAKGLRTTAAHSTLTLADSNSTAILSDGVLGRGVNEVELDRQEDAVGSRIDASHDGYVRRLGLRHKRSILVSADGKDVNGEDVLVAEGKAASVSAFAVRFHLAPSVEVSTTADGLGALLRLDRGPMWQFRCAGGTLAIDESLWVDADGALVPTQQLVVSGTTSPTGATISWSLRRAG